MAVSDWLPDGVPERLDYTVDEIADITRLMGALPRTVRLLLTRRQVAFMVDVLTEEIERRIESCAPDDEARIRMLEHVRERLELASLLHE